MYGVGRSLDRGNDLGWHICLDAQEEGLFFALRVKQHDIRRSCCSGYSSTGVLTGEL